jgi:cellulose synthase/poly-beta-1,6-N-acetylglucosamine synthase-like glycosyltransferase
MAWLEHPTWQSALSWLGYALAVVAVLPCAYLALLAVGAVLARLRERARRKSARPEQAGHLVFVVPAHDEERDILATVEGLLALADADSSIHVIADNCSDQTATVVRALMAEAAGRDGRPVQLWERNDPSKRAKGFALEWALPQIFAWSDGRGTPAAFVCVIDADAALTPGSVQRARQGFETGEAVLQSEYLFGEGLGLKAKIMQIASAAIIVRGLGRSYFGTSDTLKGNGMWFRRSVLEQIPWCAYSLAEDLEYTMLLHRAGYRVHVLAGSGVGGRLAATHEGENTQRLRWEGGRWAVVKAELGKLARAALRSPSARNLDIVAELVVPPLGLLVSLQALLLGVLLFVPGSAWVVVAAGWVMLGAVVVASVPIAGLPLRLLGALFYVPFYVLWKLLLLPRTFAASRSKRWVRTAR